MQKINKTTGLPSTEPSEMTTAQKKDIGRLSRDLKINYTEILTYLKKALKDTQESIYITYIVFDTQELEDTYLSLSDIEKAIYLEENEGNYTTTSELHPNMKVLYDTPEETDKIISICSKTEALFSEIEDINTIQYDEEGNEKNAIFDAEGRYFDLIS